MSKPLLRFGCALLLCSAAAVSARADDILANGDFQDGTAHWKDSLTATGCASASPTSSGIVIDLHPRQWTKIYQVFNTRDTRLQFGVTYTLSDDFAVTPGNGPVYQRPSADGRPPGGFGPGLPSNAPPPPFFPGGQTPASPPVDSAGTNTPPASNSIPGGVMNDAINPPAPSRPPQTNVFNNFPEVDQMVYSAGPHGPLFNDAVMFELTRVQVQSFRDTLAMNEWLAVVFDPEAQMVRYLKISSTSPNPKTVSLMFTKLLAHEEKTLYLVFPPGTGSVTLSHVSLEPVSDDTPDTPPTQPDLNHP